jgi:hypothetical protein
MLYKQDKSTQLSCRVAYDSHVVKKRNGVVERKKRSSSQPSFATWRFARGDGFSLLDVSGTQL